jgi:hypothetical protein
MSGAGSTGDAGLLLLMLALGLFMRRVRLARRG